MAENIENIIDSKFFNSVKYHVERIKELKDKITVILERENEIITNNKYLFECFYTTRELEVALDSMLKSIERKFFYHLNGKLFMEGVTENDIYNFCINSNFGNLLSNINYLIDSSKSFLTHESIRDLKRIYYLTENYPTKTMGE